MSTDSKASAIDGRIKCMEKSMQNAKRRHAAQIRVLQAAIDEAKAEAARQEDRTTTIAAAYTAARAAVDDAAEVITAMADRIMAIEEAVNRMTAQVVAAQPVERRDRPSPCG
jgi:chromosome segregation ATPase